MLLPNADELWPNAGVDDAPKGELPPNGELPKAGELAVFPNRLGVDEPNAPEAWPNVLPNAGADAWPKAGMEAWPNAGVLAFRIKKCCSEEAAYAIV